MIGIDTNVLVRYLTQDDPEQSRKANKFIQEIIAQSETGFINAIVLCEMVGFLSPPMVTQERSLPKCSNESF
jgi:predicted nucleic-acid-binding protein